MTTLITFMIHADSYQLLGRLSYSTFGFHCCLWVWCDILLILLCVTMIIITIMWVQIG